MIGIFGGTFDPVHFGHLRPALEVMQRLQLDEVRFIPCGQPPHREPPVADAVQRVAMLELALAGQRGFVLDRREIDRGGTSYMVDTLASLREELGPQRPLCLILGADAYAGLDTWHQWTRLAELAHLVVATRPDAPPLPAAVADLDARRRADSAQALREAAGGRVLHMAVTPLAISASTIRAECALGRSVRYLLPQRVLEFMQREGLYHQAGSHP